jgi:hypothetical protein
MIHAVHRVLVIAIALAGCRDGDLEELRSIKTEVCKCDTVECGEAAMKRVPKFPANARTQAVANEMMACVAKLYLKSRPSTDPDAETTGSGSGSN